MRPRSFPAVAFHAFMLFLSGTVVFTCDNRPPFERNNAHGAPPEESHIRAVWVQDMGDGSDFEAQGTRLRLMGFDSKDTRGEFVLSDTITNYARPLITRNGDRVVFSNRKSSEVFIIDWDGSNRRRITHGLGVAVWIDPATDSEWIYVARPGANTDSTGWPMGSIWRYPLDVPGSGILIWDRTDIDVDNFQVSADGSRAGGLFPWPSGGVALLPNRGWDKYGEGCWTSFAPDNSYRLWIFDGNHREITLFDTGGVNPRTIDFSGLPGIDGHEVNHPRWSNDPRYFAFSGPYRMGIGESRSSARGTEVEIHVGRFDDGYTQVETLTRLTSNRRADFFPDIWVAPSDEMRFESRTNGIIPRVDQATGSTGTGSRWPGDTTGLLFVWKNRTSSNRIMGDDGELLRSCAVEPRGSAWFGDFNGMSLRGGAFVARDMDDLIRRECGETNTISLEVVVHPSEHPSQYPVPIISYACSDASCNFKLAQVRDELRFSILRSDSPGSGTENVVFPVPDSPTYHHILICYTPGTLVCYRDGREVIRRDDVQGDLSDWMTGEMVLGNSPDGSSPWFGNIEGVAVYDRFIESPEARERARIYSEEIGTRERHSRLIVDARLMEACTVPDPSTIAPYRRALIVQKYEVLDVVSGDYDKENILVAQWAILDGDIVEGIPSDQNVSYRFTIEPFEEHSELEPERLIMSISDFETPLYYDVNHPAVDKGTS